MKIKLFMDTSALWIRWMRMLRTMRNVILMIILFGYQASAGVFSQSKVNLELKNASFKDLVDVIVEQTDLGFWYDTAQLRELNKINIDVENLSVEEVLDQVFENTDFAYEVEHKTILIRKLPQAVEVDAQEKKSVKGKVVDDQGIPLPGVSVVVKGTSVGVATDIDGNYSLESEQEKVVLVFSFVGMVSQEIVYNGQAEINVTLGLDTEQMEEVVITGYQTLKKGRATGSFNIVKSEELNTIVSTSLTDKLYGVSPGLLVNNGEITIRGISSLQAGNTPLIVLDGFPFRGELDDINPEDIEQMTVLKDAASTAIYGIEGANGVIVISTKSAEKNNKVKINYSSLVRFTEKPKYKDLGYASSSDHIDMMFNYFDQNGFQNFGGTDELSYTWFRNNVENSLSDAEANKIYDFYRKSDDLNKHMFDRNFVERHNLSMSYGTEVNQLYTSVAIEKQKIRKGINNEVNLFSFSLNDHLNINKYVDVDFILRANQNKKNIGSYDVNYLMPYTRLYDQAGNFYNTNSRYYGGADLALLESQGAKSHFKNELQEDQLIDNKKRTRQLNSIFKINVKPIDGVVWSSSFGYDYTDIKHLTFYDKESYYARNLYNSNLSNDLSYNLIPYGNIQDEVYADRKVKTLRTQLSLNKTLGDFSLSGIAGFERNEFKESGSGNIRRYNYDPQALSESFINVPQTSTFTNIYGKNVTYLPSNYAPQRKETIQRFQSVYFTGSVSYKGKYSLFGSWRSDETNLFGQSAEYRQQPSWSVGTKWNVKEEFLKEIDQINHLSLKGSYGLSGRVDHTTSPYMIISNRYDSYTGKQATYVSNPPNPSLSWEKAYTTNIGLDFGLFNKINGTIEFYNIRNEDILALGSIDPTNGWPSDAEFYTNNGVIVNRGIDASINVKMIDRKDLKYDLGISYSYNYNKLKHMDSNNLTLDDLGYLNTYVLGQSVDYIAYTNAKMIDGDNYELTKKDGTVVDASDYANWELNDLYYGRKTPSSYGSINNRIQYKNLSVGLLISYEFGHKAMTYPISSLSPGVALQFSSTIAANKNAWTPENTNTEIPPIHSNVGAAAKDAYSIGDWNVRSANNIQLKSINIGYDFTSLINWNKISGLKLNANIENLGFWAANDRLVSISQYPLYKAYSFTLNVQF